ncbi:MAG: hypothetical protein J6Z02_10175, partial [Lachnospiraceae bacterium]|nr:hypothetical protein [Lachnospiraceae bacterium]
MRKNKRIVKYLVFVAALILCTLPFTVKKAGAQAGPRLNVETECGLAGTYMGNRKMPIKVTITSQEDFSGTCGLIVHAEHNISMEKQINIAAGESKELFYYVTGDSSIEYMVYINDQKGALVYKIKFNKEGQYVN